MAESIEVAVVDRADTSKSLHIFARTRDAQYLEEYLRDGAGSFSIRANDPDILEDRDRIKEGTWISLRIGGRLTGVFQIKNWSVKTVGQGEEEEKWLVLSGPGFKGAYDDVVLLSQNGWSVAERGFNFTSPNFGGGTWPAAKYVAPGGGANPQFPNSNFWSQRPYDWPDGLQASWIWDRENTTPNGAPIGWCYFRRWVTLPRAMNLRATWSSDDMGVLFVDGVKLQENNDFYGWTKVHTVDFSLPAGNHLFGAKVYNYNTLGGFICNIAELPEGSSEVTPANYVAGTDPSWQVLAYPAEAPGYTVGKMLREISNEALARGAHSFNPSFTEIKDSYGQDWEKAADFVLPVGMEYTDVLESVASAYADIWFGVDGKLHAAPTRGDNKAELVYIRPGWNCVQASATGDGDVRNYLVVRTRAKVETYEGPALSIALYGRREAYLNMSEETVSMREALIQKFFDDKAFPRSSPVVDLYPRGDNDVPWVHFNVGDVVMGPGDLPSDPLRSRRIMSIAVKQEEGYLKYTLEIDTIEATNTERTNRRLNRVEQDIATSGRVENDLLGLTPPEFR